MLRNFILETANAPGTSSTVSLAGTVAGRMSFAQGFSSGVPVFYFMDDGSQAEWGIGTFTTGSPNTLARTTVIGNTAGTTVRLNFAGSVRVYNEVPAERMLYIDSSGHVTNTAGSNFDFGALAVAIGGGLTVGGGGAAITGNSTVTGTLTTSGKVTVSSGGTAITGNSSITGTLSTSARFTVSGGGASVTGGLTVASGGLGVTGASSINGGLSIPSGGLSVTGASSVSSGGLTVTGAGTTGSTNTFFAQNAVGGGALLIQDNAAIQLPSITAFSTGNAANLAVVGSLLSVSVSSARFKTDITTYESALADVQKLRPVRYKSRSEIDGGRTFAGLIAEEVDAAGLHEFVTYEENGRPLTVQYGQLSALACGAVAELAQQVATLTQRLVALEAKHS